MVFLARSACGIFSTIFVLRSPQLIIATAELCASRWAADSAQSLLVIYLKWQLLVAVNINTQTQNWCDFAREVSLVATPFLRQIVSELLPAEV